MRTIVLIYLLFGIAFKANSAVPDSCLKLVCGEVPYNPATHTGGTTNPDSVKFDFCNGFGVFMYKLPPHRWNTVLGLCFLMSIYR